jgi:Kef-type K+ transport system membrane component KefB
MRSAFGRAPLRGFVGRPVLAALGTVTLLRDGHVTLSSPGVDADTSSVPSVALLNDATLLDVVFKDRRAPLLLDMHETRTLLYPAFMRQFPAAVADATLTTYVGPRATGDVMSLPAYLIPTLPLAIAGTSVTLSAVPALMRNPDSRSGAFLGALGQDALQTTDRVTLDFSAMTVRFRARPPATVLPQLVYPTNASGSKLPASTVPEDIAFVVLLFALFVIPKALQRYRIASAVTSLLMGAAATSLGFFHNDPTLHLLSTFGIVALFLFAGLEIDGHELRRQASPLMLHGLVWSVLLAIGAAVAVYVFGFEVRPALLIALALLTPSTGFILSSLAGFGLLDAERFAVKTYAISSELLALTALFFVLQSTSVGHLAIAVAAMLIVVTVIPLAFRVFARVVAPHAPRSEFAFLLMVAIVAAYATRRLGVYYLVGAFLVGIAAQRFRSELPAMSSEKMVDALESFGSVFIPFYFFHAGTEIVRDQLTWRALFVGVGLLVLLIPFRVAVTMVQRRFVLRDTPQAARRIGIALVPTLVFTLVIIDILKTNFALQSYILGALVLYTVINTSIPAFALHSAPPEFESVSAADVEPAVQPPA